jgi:molybdopterin-synthase adenylyltransferase
LNTQMWTRQVAIPGFGVEGQEKLRNSKVAVLGLGGVGGPAALYLAASGIGSLMLVDGDVVEASNLNRQILFSFSDLGRPKAQTAARFLLSHNPKLNVEVVEKRVEERDLQPLLKGCDIVLDCFDRNRDRLAVNRVCLRLGIPAVHGFAQDFGGEIFSVLPGKSACLACALDEGFPEAEMTPVIGVATGIVGVAMASAAILSLTGLGTLRAGARQIFDLAFTEIMKVPVEMNPHCPACGK